MNRRPLADPEVTKIRWWRWEGDWKASFFPQIFAQAFLFCFILFYCFFFFRISFVDICRCRSGGWAFLIDWPKKFKYSQDKKSYLLLSGNSEGQWERQPLVFWYLSFRGARRSDIHSLYIQSKTFLIRNSFINNFTTLPLFCPANSQLMAALIISFTQLAMFC